MQDLVHRLVMFLVCNYIFDLQSFEPIAYAGGIADPRCLTVYLVEIITHVYRCFHLHKITDYQQGTENQYKHTR